MHTIRWSLVYARVSVRFALSVHAPLCSDERRTKKAIQYVKRILSLLRAVVKFCTTNRLFGKFGNLALEILLKELARTLRSEISVKKKTQCECSTLIVL